MFVGDGNGFVGCTVSFYFNVSYAWVMGDHANIATENSNKAATTTVLYTLLKFGSSPINIFEP